MPQQRHVDRDVAAPFGEDGVDGGRPTRPRRRRAWRSVDQRVQSSPSTSSASTPARSPNTSSGRTARKCRRGPTYERETVREPSRRTAMTRGPLSPLTRHGVVVRDRRRRRVDDASGHHSRGPASPPSREMLAARLPISLPPSTQRCRLRLGFIPDGRLNEMDRGRGDDERKTDDQDRDRPTEGSARPAQPTIGRLPATTRAFPRPCSALGAVPNNRVTPSLDASGFRPAIPAPPQRLI